MLDEKYGVEMFVLKVTKSEDEPEFNKIPIYYQEMINVWQTLKQKERSCHSVTEPGEQYLWCNHLIHIDGKEFNDSKWAKKGILKVKDVIDEDGELRYISDTFDFSVCGKVAKYMYNMVK